jgi:hypothetical protein
MVYRDLSRNVDWMWRADCMASSVAGSNSDGFFSCGDTWRSKFTQALPGLSKILWQDFKQLWQQSIPTCYSVFKRMPCGALPYALKWMEAASNMYCSYEAPMIWSFDSLHHLTVTCILETKHHRTYVVFFLDLFFNKESHYGELVHEFCFILYK